MPPSQNQKQPQSDFWSRVSIGGYGLTPQAQQFLRSQAAGAKAHLRKAQAGIRAYAEMVGEVDGRPTGMYADPPKAPPSAAPKPQSSRTTRPQNQSRKQYGVVVSPTGAVIMRHYPLQSDYSARYPTPKAAYQDRVSDFDISRLADGSLYKSVPGEELVIGTGVAQGRWIPLSLGKALGRYIDPDTNKLITLPGDFRRANTAFTRLDQGELLRRKDALQQVDRRYEATPIALRREQARGRGAFDGFTVDNGFPWVAASTRTVFDGGDFWGNLAAERRIGELDKLNHPYARGSGELVGSYFSPNLFGKAKTAGKASGFLMDIADGTTRGAAGALASSYGTEDDIGAAMLRGAATDAAMGQLSKWGTDGLYKVAQSGVRHLTDYDAYRLLEPALSAEGRSLRGAGPNLSPFGAPDSSFQALASATLQTPGPGLRASRSQFEALRQEAVQRLQTTQQALTQAPGSPALQRQLARDRAVLAGLDRTMNGQTAGDEAYRLAVGELAFRPRNTLNQVFLSNDEALSRLADQAPIYRGAEQFQGLLGAATRKGTEETLEFTGKKILAD